MNANALNDYLVDRFDVLPQAVSLVDRCESNMQPAFAAVDRRSELLQYRVIDAFRSNEIASMHFGASTGYGYGDLGREKLSVVFADVMGAEDAIVSPLLMSGTHAISTALFGVLRPGDRVVSVTGEPYDTMQSVIRNNPGSLEELGVQFDTVPLNEDGSISTEAAIRVAERGREPAMIYLQRSTGYDLRPAFTTEQLRDAIEAIRTHAPSAIVLVDNCYGEFVNDTEPTQAGADLIAGSLIKNPGGGLAPTGGYIAGTRGLIERVSSRYSAPGVGREIGSYTGGYQYFYQGLFMAPHTVGQALKGVMLAARVFSEAGYIVTPGPEAERGDITQTIRFNDPDLLTSFVRGVQRASAIDAHVIPYAWDMPGYDSQVIMAAGTFVQGASLELTADAPLRPPFAAYLQGGLTYPHAKLGILCALSDVLRATAL